MEQAPGRPGMRPTHLAGTFFPLLLSEAPFLLKIGFDCSVGKNDYGQFRVPFS